MKLRWRSLATHAALLLATCVAVVPLAWLLRTALGTRLIATSNPPIIFFTPTLDSFIAVLTGDFTKYLFNSAVIVTSSVAIVMVLGSLAGYSLARFNIKGKESLFFYVISTRMGPPIAFALPFYLIYQSLGLLDTHIGLIIIYTAVNLAFAVWMTRSFFEDIPASVEEAAMVDGLSRFRAFVRLTLPQARGGLVATAIFMFIIAWNEFFYAAMLTREDARTFTTQIPAYIGFSRIRWEEMAAASIIGVLPVIVFAVLARRNLVRGFTFGQVR